MTTRRHRLSRRWPLRAVAFAAAAGVCGAPQARLAGSEAAACATQDSAGFVDDAGRWYRGRPSLWQWLRGYRSCVPPPPMPRRLQPASVVNYWQGPADGDWNNPAHWSLGLPQPDHDLLGYDFSRSVISAGDSFAVRSFVLAHELSMRAGSQLSFTEDSSLFSFYLRMQSASVTGTASLAVGELSLSGNSSIAVDGTFSTWRAELYGGSLSAKAGILVSGYMTMHVSPELLIEGDLLMTGLAQWRPIPTGETDCMCLKLAPGTLFHNQGTFEDDPTERGSILGGEGSSFLNSVNYFKINSGSSFIGIAFENEANATLRVSSGVLTLGETSVLRGTLDVRDGAVLQLAAPSGGPHRLIGLDASANLGQLLIAGPVSVEGASRIGGSVSIDNGSLAVAAGASFDMARLDLLSGQLQTQSPLTLGETTWRGGRILVAEGSAITSTGRFVDATSGGWAEGLDPGRPGQLINRGDWVKTASGTTTITLGFVNEPGARLAVDAGTLLLGHDSLLSGQVQVAYGGRLQLGWTARHALNDMDGSSSLGELFMEPGTSVSVAGTSRWGGVMTVSPYSDLTTLGELRVATAFLDGGTLDGTGALVVTDLGEWNTGSVMLGAGTTRFEGIARISAKPESSFVALAQRTVELAGTTYWGSPHIEVGGGGRLVNTGTLFSDGDAGADKQVRPWAAQAGGGRVENRQQWAHRTGDTQILIDFTNTPGATLAVESGTLTLGGGSSLGGALRVDGGSTLNLAAGPLHEIVDLDGAGSAGALQLSGTAQVAHSGNSHYGGTLIIGNTNSAPTLSVAGSFTAASLRFDNGYIRGPGELIVESPFVWTGGLHGDAGRTTFLDAVTIDPASRVQVQGRTVELRGDTTWTGSSIQIGAGGRFLNRGRFLDVTTDGEMLLPPVSGTGDFVNVGSYTKTGTGQTSLRTGFTNEPTGTLRVQTGSLLLDGGSVLSGTVEVLPEAILRFGNRQAHVWRGLDATGNLGRLELAGAQVAAEDVNTVGGRLVLSGNASLSVRDQTVVQRLEMSGDASVRGLGELRVLAPFDWRGGSFYDAGTTRFEDTVSISTGINNVQGRQFVLAGDTDWSGGTIQIGGYGSITNQGSFTDRTQGDGLLGQIYVPGTGAFVNAHRYTKTGNAPTTAAISFVNLAGATLAVEAGELVLQRDSVLSGQVTTAPGSLLRLENVGTWSGLDASQGATRIVVQGAGVTALGNNRVANLRLAGVANLLTQCDAANPQCTLNVGRLEMAGNPKLRGNASVFVGEFLDWQGGWFLDPGSTVVYGAAQVSAGDNGVQGRTLVLSGQTQWTGGTLQIGGNGSIVNAGHFTDLNPVDNTLWQSFVPGSAFFVNRGRFTKGGPASSVTKVIPVFVNAPGATVAVERGTLHLQGGSELAGSLTVSANQVFELGAGTRHTWQSLDASANAGALVMLGAPVTAAGTNVVGGLLSVVRGANLRIDGSVQAEAFYISDGSVVNGAGALNVLGDANWLGGQFQNGGPARFSGGVSIQGGNNLVQGTTVTLAKETLWTNSTIGIGGNGRLVNSGSFHDLTVDEGSIGILFVPGTTTFENAGSFYKERAGVTTVGPTFVNTADALLQINAGQLVLSGGSSLSGRISVSNGAELRLAGGTTHLLDDVFVAGRLVLDFGSGTVSGRGDVGARELVQRSGSLRIDDGSLGATSFELMAGDVSVSGGAAANDFRWSGGRLLNTVMSSRGGAINGPNSKVLVSSTLLLEGGSTTWTDGDLALGGASRLRVTGPWGAGGSGTFVDAAGGRTITHYDPVAGSGRFENFGTFVKTVGGHTVVTIPYVQYGSGQVRVEAGTLTLNNLLYEPDPASQSSRLTAAASLPGLVGGSFAVLSGAALVYGGPPVVTNTASLTLEGVGSAIRLLDGRDALAGLAANAAEGTLTLRQGRELALAGGFTNAGLVQLGSGGRLSTAGSFANTAAGRLTLDGGTWAGSTLDNAGQVSGFGELAGAVAGAGRLVATGGTLALRQGGQAGELLLAGGRLSLGDDLRLSGDYDNAAFGVGAAFDPRAGIDGPGRILAATPVTLQLAGAHVVGGTQIVLPSFRTGQGGVAGSFAIGHGGDGPPLRGTVRAIGGVDAALSGTAFEGQNWGPVGGGQWSPAYTVRFDPAAGQVLDGQALQVVANFDNVLPQTVAISGRAYSPALAVPATTRVDFGIVRVGDMVPVATLAIGNLAPGTLTDALWATLGSAAGPFAAQGQTAGLAAGQSDASSLTVQLDTRSNGVFAGHAELALMSRNGELADLDLGTQVIELQARVHAPAFATLALAGGEADFHGGGSRYSLDFGDLRVGEGLTAVQLSLRNGAEGVADDLGGSFDFQGISFADWSLTGFGSFAGLAPGQTAGMLQIALQPDAVGLLAGTIRLSTRSTNGVGPDLWLGDIELHLSAHVAAVPEPGTWALWLAGLAVTGGLARRRRGAVSAPVA